MLCMLCYILLVTDLYAKKVNRDLKGQRPGWTFLIPTGLNEVRATDFVKSVLPSLYSPYYRLRELRNTIFI
jgi:hypothetical protein